MQVFVKSNFEAVEVRPSFLSMRYRVAALTGKTVQRNLQSLSVRCETLLIATDNDREGENIGFEVYNVCRQGARALVLGLAC